MAETKLLQSFSKDSGNLKRWSSTDDLLLTVSNSPRSSFKEKSKLRQSFSKKRMKQIYKNAKADSIQVIIFKYIFSKVINS